MNNESENGIELIIKENEGGSFIDCSLGYKKIHQLDYSGWFKSFLDHYNQMTKSEAIYAWDKGNQLATAYIPLQAPRVRFRVDYGHAALKFFLDPQDTETKKIVYAFLEMQKQRL
jgi:hypothetical protein